MRKPILMEEREIGEELPTKEIEEIQANLYEYLKDYIADTRSYSKHAIMGPSGKLLSIISAQMFGSNVDAYVGYIANVHDTQSKKLLSSQGMEKLRAATQKLVELRQKMSERSFLKLVRAVDYGVYYLKIKDIAKHREEKRQSGEVRTEQKEVSQVE